MIYMYIATGIIKSAVSPFVIPDRYISGIHTRNIHNNKSTVTLTEKERYRTVLMHKQYCCVRRDAGDVVVVVIVFECSDLFAFFLPSDLLTTSLLAIGTNRKHHLNFGFSGLCVVKNSEHIVDILRSVQDLDSPG